MVEISPGHTRTEVTEIDRFGNVALAVSLDTLDLDGVVELAVTVEEETEQEWRCRVVNTFSDLKPGELGILQDSWGHASLALDGASAAALLGARLGSKVRITPLSVGFRGPAAGAQDPPAPAGGVG